MQAIKLLVAFLWVGLPLGWGVFQSVKKSMPLIKGEPSAPAGKAG